MMCLLGESLATKSSLKKYLTDTHQSSDGEMLQNWVSTGSEGFQEIFETEAEGAQRTSRVWALCV